MFAFILSHVNNNNKKSLKFKNQNFEKKVVWNYGGELWRRAHFPQNMALIDTVKLKWLIVERTVSALLCMWVTFGGNASGGHCHRDRPTKDDEGTLLII